VTRRGFVGRSAQRPTRDSGQAAVELTLTLPLVLIMLMAVVQVGIIVRDQVLVLHGAREAARQAAVSPDPQGSAQFAAMAATGFHDLDVSVEVTDRLVIVHVHRDAPTDVPLVGVVLGDVGLDATVTMHRER
jgi:Flp pilus assembly protein TadG